LLKDFRKDKKTCNKLIAINNKLKYKCDNEIPWKSREAINIFYLKTDLERSLKVIE